MSHRRARLALALAAGLFASATAATPSSAEDEAPVVPNAGLATDATGWSVSSNATAAWGEVASKPSDQSDPLTDPVPNHGGLGVRSTRSSTQTVTVTSSSAGRPLDAGSVVRVVAPVRVSRAVPVTLTVREIATSGSTVGSQTYRRTVSTGWRFLSTTLTTTRDDSHVQVVVQARAAKRPTVTLGGLDVFTGTAPFAAPEVLLTNPARSWVAHHSDTIDLSGRRDRIVNRVASQPTGSWLTEGDGLALTTPLDSAVAKAEHLNGSATIVLYWRPHRWDGLSGFEGAKSLTAYKKFIDRVADRIGPARINVVVEPDGLWFNEQARQLRASGTKAEDEQLNYSAKDVKDQLAAIRYAATRLSALPSTRVFIEAGTSSGSVSPDDMGAALKRAGASSTVGFVVNVSSYSPEATITPYADAVRAKLMSLGVHNPRYAVDTGRNGDPAWTGYETPQESKPWCNWPGAKLGLEPGPATVEQQAHGRVLNLWVKGPGESDGECRGDDPPGGVFMPDYADSMAQ